MTGENFMRLNRQDTTKHYLIDKLEKAKEAFSSYIHINNMRDNKSWSFDEMNRLEKIVEFAQYKLDCYMYNK